MIRWVDVEPRATGDASPDFATVAMLAVATLGAIAAVWLTVLKGRRGAG